MNYLYASYELFVKLLYCERLGTLDGFSFDSDEEADKPVVEADQQEAGEEQPADGKTKKKTDKKTVWLLLHTTHEHTHAHIFMLYSKIILVTL